MEQPCWRCGRPVDPTTVGAYREVIGWERVRSGGGANSIVMRSETGRVGCPACIMSMKSGLHRDQDVMF